MRKRIEYIEEDGSIEIDNSELLAQRADMDDEIASQRLSNNELGCNNYDRELKHDKRRTNWHEPDVKTRLVIRTCPICNSPFKGRTNQIYCLPSCKAKANLRKYRAKQRLYRGFKPTRGLVGEIYFMATTHGKDVITFVPAYYADTRVRAKTYLLQTFPYKNVENYYAQVCEVLKK